MKKGTIIMCSVMMLIPLAIAQTIQAQTPGPKIGAFLPDPDWTDPNPWTIPEFEQQYDPVTGIGTGHDLDIFLWYQNWQDMGIDSARLLPIAMAGHSVELAWLPFDIPEGQPCAGPVSIKAISEPETALGSCYDQYYIRPWANSIASFMTDLPSGVDVLFRPMNEMNGTWGLDWAYIQTGADPPRPNRPDNAPQYYKQAWLRIHQVFDEEGATNVKWLWAPNRDLTTGNATDIDCSLENLLEHPSAQRTFNCYYPENEEDPNSNYVDVIGIDGYTWGCDLGLWEELDQIFGPSYDVFANRTKDLNEETDEEPLMIAETAAPEYKQDWQCGSTFSRNKADWISRAYISWLPYRFPRITRATWFNKIPEDESSVNFRINSSTSSSEAFSQAMQSLYDNSYFTNYYDIQSADEYVIAGNPASLNNSNSINPTSTPAGLTEILEDDHGIVVVSAPQSGGPVKIVTPQLLDNPLTHTSTKLVGSLRTRWHDNGGNSLEEVSARKFSSISDHYYWPWYDADGFGVWLSVANPNPFPLYYEARTSGSQSPPFHGIVASNQTELFVLTGSGGPLEIQAWVADPVDNSNPDIQSHLAPAFCIPSQRVLYNGNRDFTEIPGIPDKELSDRYLWPWYDMQSSGAQDWVMIANPNPAAVDYTLTIRGAEIVTGTLQAAGAPNEGDIAYRAVPGLADGPVEVVATYNVGGAPAKVVASQRNLWYAGSGVGNFEEVAGLSASTEGGVSHLGSTYYWPWYDYQAPGAFNWIIVANPGTSDLDFTVSIGGADYCPPEGCHVSQNSRTILAYPGAIGGPVEIAANGDVVASQRVLWNWNNINELMGVSGI